MKIDWFYFSFKLCGYDLRENGRIMPKYIIYDRYKKSINDLEQIILGIHPEIKRYKKRDKEYQEIWQMNRKMV